MSGLVPTFPSSYVKMTPHSSFLASLLILAFFLPTLPQCYSQENDTYSICRQSLFSCGTLTNISYPFWGGNRPHFCGRNGFNLTCMHNQSTSLQLGSQKFNVLNINQTASTLRLVRTDLVYDRCSSNFTNTSLSATPFSFLPAVQNVTVFYECPSGNSVVGNSFTCRNDSNKHAFYVVNGTQLKQFLDLQKCGVSVQVQVSQGVVWDSKSGVGTLEKALDQGFEVEYDAEWSSQCTACKESGGACGAIENDLAQFSCYCSGGTHGSVCSTHKSGRKHRVLKLVLGFIGTGFALPLIAVIICRNKAMIWKFILTQCGKIKRDDRAIEAFLESQGSMGLKRYSYTDVKKMTDSFKIKLGEGGYGSVYKGKLLNGCSAAVKILNESKGNGEEFINEVASISKTSHVNIVSLLGFCLEGSRKALIYEFMPNGSLEKYLHNKKADKSETTTPWLSWERLHEIAIGIARGLEYLHKGCNTRILHFDIKPHNILLDGSYRPKISDFGLAKLSTRDESIISMSNARGTIGYVAPELFNKSFGGVSHKSDVYSYGMMLLEMVGGHKNVDVDEASRSSEKYFPQLVIYKKLEQGSDFGVDGENEIAKRMTMVGLWCIQTIPSHRPTISRVIDMLEGTTDSLEMPPKPFLSSPPRSTTTDFSTAVSKSLQSV
ncbi:LEAF RUST 10 DISEASE-RESISTANCE LOCUS RECEPTOR-LIKE PROTEIN KINASE-like 2.1 [Cajanus cajan]|uniref:LEAF RUST 10 DISEASE-RESISTANCE LOCUS RECEPTOR-LIKE PROTEIN KINASE-like 2.1 n=1 Tax=Cajanus cajan TaxID=3821 RepID=UPI0010FB0A73|nr:LEAF RUST 10 DISEASE-RESISTANCE LOCUS RECEPTOR-LIKE PROTEIN KINASE-like 2.1 [Cajanus cajan]